jgi:hypothetical protein|nr:MAG TPA: hypothetical protein [Caudoviricetes sp.]
MTELEIKILANKTYDSMVSQMRNIPGTTDKEIDIFMDKFTKNLREILIENNPEDDTKSFKEELIEKEIQNRAADKLYKTVFDRAETEEIKQNMLLNVAYIIDCCILESCNTTHFDLFDVIYHNILDVYFNQICHIELSRDDRRIIVKMILIILNSLNKKLANRYLNIDGLFINNTIPEWTRPLSSAIKFWTDIIPDDDDEYLDHIVESVLNNIKDIMDKMKSFIPVFRELRNNDDNILTTDNYINEFLSNAGYDIPATRIITINPCSFDYERKFGFLINQLKNIMEEGK